MTPTLLRFIEEPSTGLPRLEDPAGLLDPAERERLGRELDRDYARLIRDGGERFVNLPHPEGGPPLRWFRVTVVDLERRCPTLLLEPVEPEHAEAQIADRFPPDSRWRGGFLAAVADLMSPLGPETEAGRALQFVLGDLRALARKDADKLAALLLVGYLHVGDALWRRHGSGENPYARAAEALARIPSFPAPAAALEPLLCEPAPAEAPPGPVATGRRQPL